jgi:hypothetical protein
MGLVFFSVCLKSSSDDWKERLGRTRGEGRRLFRPQGLHRIHFGRPQCR